MDSPLGFLYNAVASRAGRPEERLPQGKQEFTFGGEFPDKPSPALSPLAYLVTVGWDEAKRTISVSTGISSCATFVEWDGMTVFFENLSATVSLFTEVWPGGWMVPLIVPDKPGALRLGHHAKLSCPLDYDIDVLRVAFKEVNECATQALLFTRPLGENFAARKHVPPVEDVIRTLSIEFEKYESYCLSRGEDFPRVPRWFGANRATIH